MSAQVSVEMRFLFEGGADLTMLSCSARRIWTASVGRSISQYNLPTPLDLADHLDLGDITDLAEFTGPKTITKFVAYAASVLNGRSDAQSIEKIGAKIGKITQARPEIRSVEAVLFGTGRGRLRDSEAAIALTKGFLKTAHLSARLEIVVQGHERHKAVSEAVEAVQRSGALSTNKFRDIRIAVIVALAEEYDIFCRYFDGRLVEKYHVGNITVDVLERNGTDERIGLTSVTQMGNVAAAVAATRLLEVFDLETVVNLGIAAGIDRSKQNLGDIIIADQIRYYESGKLSERFEVSPSYTDLQSAVLKSLKLAHPGSWPLGASIGGAQRQVHFGTVASGEKVIAQSEFAAALLTQDRKIVGIEMESHGIAAALHGRQEKFLLIRGISDFADHAKNDSARLSAMEGAVRLFNEALKRNLLTGSGLGVRQPSEAASQGYSVILTDRVVREGVANNYVEIASTKFLDAFQTRREIIEKMASKFNIDDLRVFCIQLGVDFDELIGNTKTAKAASLLEVVERKKLLALEDLGVLLDQT